MKMNKNEFIDIMSSDIGDNVSSFLVSFRTLQKYTNHITLENDTNGDVYHSADIEEILFNNITEEDLLSIRSSGWRLDDNKENIVKYFV